jgi:two-component system, OmpR family, phosphate regulon response regulator PhoB
VIKATQIHIRPHSSPPLPHIRVPQVHAIDDNPADKSRKIQLRLKPYGVIVLRSFDSVSGLMTLLEDKPDVILANFIMPDHAGQRLIRWLRTNKETCRTPIIVLTVRTDEQLQCQVEGLGMVSYLTKPLGIAELRRVLRRYIPLPGDGQEARSYVFHPPHRFIRLYR